MLKDINLEEGGIHSVANPALSTDLPAPAGDLAETARPTPLSVNSDHLSTRRADKSENPPVEPSHLQSSTVSSPASSPLLAALHPDTPMAGEFECLPTGLMLGKCRIERLIGQGGMGQVYLAHHLALDVPVAIKVLIPRPGKEMAEQSRRFVREARLASRIRHSHVVQMLDVGTDEATGVDYIVQEYVGGGSVSDLMKKGTIEEGQALDIILGVASALTAAAGFNIVHRDIKPENILLTERGEAKLADLGIAKEYNGQDGGLTVSHMMMGTPFYISPEQARDTKRVDARADIYSLGATLYHMLCGQPPYPGETAMEVLSNLIIEPVPDPLLKRPDLSPGVAALIMRMMAKDSVDRPATAVLLLEELKVARRTVVSPRHPMATWTDSAPARSDHAVLPQPLRAPASVEMSRIGWLKWAAVLLVGLIASGKAWSWNRHQQQQRLEASIAATRIEVARHLAAARDGLKSGHLNEALVAVAEVEKLAAANLEAAMLRKKIEGISGDPKRREAKAEKANDLSKVTGASYSSLIGLAAGSREAQGRQKAEAERLGFPLVIRHDKTGIELVYIPAGEFLMGSPITEANHCENELQHKVILTKGFYMGKTEVTQAQWQAIMGNNPSSFKENDDLPVEQVSWNDCQSFCQKTGFRLPTEAEWEYACRAGTTGPCAGFLLQMGWCGKNSHDKPQVVAGKSPNAWGLFDMHGNVFEWCSDRFGKYPTGDVTNPTGVDTESFTSHVFRGGSWDFGAEFCRSAFRGLAPPDEHNNTLGFRVVKSLSRLESGLGFETLGRVQEITLAGGVKLELRICPAGTFTMGSPAGETGRNAEEIRHQVAITRPFWVGKTEVTQAQWQALMEDNPSRIKGSNLPVENVDWDAVVSFSKKLTALTLAANTLPDGYEYRLPTEAEWEYACRAGSIIPYAGFGRLDDMGWYDDNSGNKTHQVAQKEANPWGFYDMHGNVWEWCQDWYGNYSTGAEVDPVGPSTGEYGMTRGGGYASEAGNCRAATRGKYIRNGRNPILGFRIALAPIIK